MNRSRIFESSLHMISDASIAMNGQTRAYECISYPMKGAEHIEYLTNLLFRLILILVLMHAATALPLFFRHRLFIIFVETNYKIISCYHSWWAYETHSGKSMVELPEAHDNSVKSRFQYEFQSCAIVFFHGNFEMNFFGALENA